MTNVGPLTGSTAEELQQIARLTKARTLLTGTKRHVESGIRISIRLLDAATGELLLARSWENSRNDESVSSLDDSAARSLYPIISRNDRIDHADAGLDAGLRNNDAREAILAGRELMFRYTAPDLERAIELLKKAVQIEPNSGLAHAYLASALTGRAHYMSDDASLIVAETEAKKAVALSPESADVHRALAGVLYLQGQFQQAIEELLSTVELRGADDSLERFVGMTFDTLGYPERALLWYDRARRSAKHSGELHTAMGDAWVKLGADERAMLEYQRAEELQPGLLRARVGVAHLRMLQGDFDTVWREYQGTHESSELGDSSRIDAQVEFFARNFEIAAKLYSALSISEPRVVVYFMERSIIKVRWGGRFRNWEDLRRQKRYSCVVCRLSAGPLSSRPPTLRFSTAFRQSSRLSV